jgi:hypothetical protein
MKERKMAKIIIFLFMFGFILFYSCNNRVAKSTDHSIQTREGIIYIDNPASPPTNREYFLEEELSIGDEDDDNYLFARPRQLCLDSFGNIYVLDFRKCIVQVYDKKGRFKISIGAKGEGPGELLLPISFFLERKKKIVHILDKKNRKISRYGLDGNFKSDFKLTRGSPEFFCINTKGHYLIWNSKINDSLYQSQVIEKWSQEGKRLQESSNFLLSKKKIDIDKNIAIGGTTPFEPQRYFGYDSKSNIYSGFSDIYKIVLFDTAFKKHKVITKKVTEKIKIGKDEINDFVESLTQKAKKMGIHLRRNSLLIQTDYPFFMGFWIDERDWLWVKTPSNDGKVHIDLFDQKGIYVEKLVINEPSDGALLKDIFSNPLIEGRNIYTAVMNDNGIYLIKKYRILKK